MSDAEDNVSPVRKTRSGRPLKNTPAKAKASPKTPGRRTRKKVVVVEVEVTDEEEMEQVTDFNEPIAKKPKVDTIDEEIDEYTALEQVIINDVEMLDEASEEAVKNGKDENIMVQSDDQIPDESETQEVSNSKDSEDLINEEELLREPTESVIELSEETPLDDSIINDEESLESKQNIDYLDEEETAAVVETRIEDIEMPKEVPNGDPEAENISDEELPGVPIVKVPETEEVSDEELPGPKRAELPADTEVVSEDELPSTKKDTEDEADNKNIKISEKEAESGYDPTSPTSESESTLKKKAEKEEKEKDDTTKTSKPKKLPELEKYWKAVNDDPTDFTGWTYLLQYVDQENDMEAAREAYAAFLSHYPYCYGYWRKFADYEKRKGNKKKCEEVFERGLKAIPLSVDLWIHYLTYVKSSKGDDEEFVRSQFELALAKCGLEFRSDRLWESYIKWETDGKRLQRVTGVYDRLITTPTQNYTVHFDNFQEHVSSNSPNKILEVDEFMALRKEVRGMLKTAEDQKVAESGPDLPPGDEDTKLYTTEEETKCIRERIVSIRRKMHKNTVNAVTVRWNFEEGIKRPYFHVKPLERCQLKNWQDYLDYEIEQGDKTRIIVLFERCLIACALYEDFWLKFVHYLETLQDPEQEMIRDVYERACTIHHLKKPNLHLQWAAFEETCSNNNRAAEILVNLEKQIPNILQVAYRRINLERRKSNFDKCVQLFEHYINGSKNKGISSNMAIKYSRFCHKVLNEFDKAEEILKNAIEKDPNNPRLYLQLIDLTLQKETVPPVDKICAIMDAFLTKETTEIEQKVLFAQRKLEFLEDFGPSVKSVQTALTDFQNYQKLCKEVASKKKEIKADAAGAAAASSASSSSTKKEKTASTSSAAQSQSYANYNAAAGGTSSSGQTAYSYSGAQQGQYNYGQYGQGDQYQYQGWQYPQSGTYSGYNQWGGYTGGYTY